jgi:hypothetical protein
MMIYDDNCRFFIFVLVLCMIKLMLSSNTNLKLSKC